MFAADDVKEKYQNICPHHKSESESHVSKLKHSTE